MLQVQFDRRGICLPALQLWLDPHRSVTGADRVFVSHAHSDHTGAHREVVLSEPTARLMRTRIGGKRIEHRLEFGKPRGFETDGVSWRITLLPAGHILGSAMALIETSEGSLLYTGDFKLRQGLCAETCEPRPADVLIMETTFGRPEYRFPPAADVMACIVRFCRETIDQDQTAILYGYSLGRSQELLRGLDGTKLPILLHEAAYQITRIYEEFGWRFPAYERLEDHNCRGKVLICPSNAKLPMLNGVGHRIRSAVVTGWAMDSSCRYRYQTDEAFPLSDHADFPELIELVNRVRPKQIFTVHGFGVEFAQTLRELGFDARAPGCEEQLSLPLSIATV